MNRFAAALSLEADLATALDQVTGATKAELAGGRPSLALLFVSHHHAAGFEELARKVRARTGADRLLGVAAESIVGGAREVEKGPALSLWLGSFPEGEVETFHLEVEIEGDTARLKGFPGIEAAAGAAPAKQSVLLFGEPFSFPADAFLEQMNREAGEVPVVGGMASGGTEPGMNRLFVDDECVQAGAVGAILRGITLRHVVSQGCRPVGRAMVITRCHGNVIEELAGRPPLEQLRDVFEKADADDKRLLQRAMRGGGLHIGQVVDERISNPARGDFLVRGVVGADQKSGAVQVGDQVRRGRTVRFHVRDAVSADDDLKDLLGQARQSRAPAAALLFTCNGRGTRFFERPDHDAGSVQEHAGAIPAAGFFAAGEIGPIGGKNFLHGFTASVALFESE